jgi:hypothetical protein
MDPDKSQAAKEWPIPKSIEELRRFLGFTSYNRRFVKDYVKVAKPLNEEKERGEGQGQDESVLFVHS